MQDNLQLCKMQLQLALNKLLLEQSLKTKWKHSLFHVSCCRAQMWSYLVILYPSLLSHLNSVNYDNYNYEQLWLVRYIGGP